MGRGAEAPAPRQVVSGQDGARPPGRGERATRAPRPRAPRARHAVARPAWLSAASPGSPALGCKGPWGRAGSGVREPAQCCGCVATLRAEPEPGTRCSSPARATSGPLRASPGARGELRAWGAQSLGARTRHSRSLVPGGSERQSEDLSTRGQCLGKGGFSGARGKERKLSTPPGTQQRACTLG